MLGALSKAVSVWVLVAPGSTGESKELPAEVFEKLMDFIPVLPPGGVEVGTEALTLAGSEHVVIGGPWGIVLLWQCTTL